MQEVIFSWSSGKDSAYALYQLLNDPNYKVLCLMTTFSEYNRVGFHGVAKELVQKQADSIGISLDSPIITSCESLDEYALKLEKKLNIYPESGLHTIAYGDIFLEDLKEYRLKILDKIGMKPLMPIWKKDTTELIKEFVDLGFKAITTCVDSKVLDESFVGRIIDNDFINDLPENVDHCGENGEFHTFVFDGPIFKEPIKFRTGEVLLKNDFYYCDLLLQEELVLV